MVRRAALDCLRCGGGSEPDVGVFRLDPPDRDTAKSIYLATGVLERNMEKVNQLDEDGEIWTQLTTIADWLIEVINIILEINFKNLKVMVKHAKL